MTTRRDCLKTGLAGGALLNIAACTRPSEDGGRARILIALIPVVLHGALSSAPAQAEKEIALTISGIEKAIRGLSLATQKEIGELFDLLAFPPTRILAAGIWAPWETATPQALNAFLEGWRQSRFDLLKSGYAALQVQLIILFLLQRDKEEEYRLPQCLDCLLLI